MGKSSFYFLIDVRLIPMLTISNFKVHQVVITIGILLLSSSLISPSPSHFSYYTHEMAFNYGNYERTRDRYRVKFLFLPFCINRLLGATPCSYWNYDEFLSHKFGIYDLLP